MRELSIQNSLDESFIAFNFYDNQLIVKFLSTLLEGTSLVLI